MNRAEKRRNNKTKYSYTFDEIKQIKQNAINEECRVLFIMTFALPLMVMHDEHDWKKKRLTDLMEKILSKYEAIQRGELSIQDVVQFIDDSIGVRFEKEGEGIVKTS